MRELVARELAQCVLGNHELNVVRGVHKDGNGWFFADDHDRKDGKYTGSRQATATERQRIVDFCSKLPIALERSDLRVTHACWDSESLRAIADDSRSLLAIHEHYAKQLKVIAVDSGLKARADAEEAQYKKELTDESATVPLLINSGEEDVLYQMGNPLRIITSGQEQLADTPFYASGKWRMVARVDWWSEYRDPVPVLFGHYWRSWSATDYGVAGHPKRDAFPGTTPCEWLGPAANSYCVDYSIGARFREREASPDGPFKTRLTALRWPERLLVSDLGEQISLS